MSRLCCILLGGPDREIMADGKRWLFEMHPYCGPVPINRRTGKPLKRGPGPRSKFWLAVGQWGKQGKAIDAEGLCVWHYDSEPITKHLAGRQYEIIGWNPPVLGG